MNRSPGRILFLNGPSSAGKSTIARQIQALLDPPPMHLSSDLLTDGALPVRSDGYGPARWWTATRRATFTGYHRCLAAMSSAGLEVVADSLLEAPDWRRELAETLRGLDVWLVGVHCDLAELERRELARGDRRVGEARTHLVVDEVHTFGVYDFEIDTTAITGHAAAVAVLRSWHESSECPTSTRALWSA